MNVVALVFSHLVEHYPYAGLFLLLVLGGLGLPIPEDAILILCGFLIGTRAVDPVAAVLVVYAGILCVDYGLYLVGRKYGRMIVTHKRFHKLLPPARLARLEEKFHSNGIVILLLGRHLIVLRAQLFLVAGVLKLKAWKFILADGVSSVITIGIFVTAGYFAGKTLGTIEDYRPIEYGVSGAAALLLIGFVAYKLIARRRRNKAAAEKDRVGGRP